MKNLTVNSNTYYNLSALAIIMVKLITINYLMRY